MRGAGAIAITVTARIAVVDVGGGLGRAGDEYVRLLGLGRLDEMLSRSCMPRSASILLLATDGRITLLGLASALTLACGGHSRTMCCRPVRKQIRAHTAPTVVVEPEDKKEGRQRGLLFSRPGMPDGGPARRPRRVIFYVRTPRVWAERGAPVVPGAAGCSKPELVGSTPKTFVGG